MENELTFRDLLAVMVKKWRLLLACMLICGILLGGYRVWSVSRSLPGGEESTEIWQAYEQELETYSRKQSGMEVELQQLNQRLEHAYEYNANSLLLRVDPYHATIGKLSFAVSLEHEVVSYLPGDPGEAGVIHMDELMLQRIAGQYVVLGQNASLRSLLMETEYADYAAYDERYLQELIKISCNDQGIVTIQVYSVDQVDGLDVAEEIFDYLTNKRAIVEKTTCAHELVILSKVRTAVVDQALLENQFENERKPAAIIESVSNKEKEIEELIAPDEPTMATMASAVKSGVKYGVLGLAAGLCLGAVLAFLSFTADTRLQRAEQLTRGLKLRFLGAMEQCKPCRGLDAVAARMTGESQPLPQAEAVALIRANIGEFAKGAKRLLITGSLPQETLAAAAEKLRPELEQLGMEWKTGGNVLQNAETVELLAWADSVILVESRGKSSLTEVDGEVIRLKESGKEPVGVVLA